MLLLLAALVAGGCTVLTVLLILLQVPLFVVQCITMYQNLLTCSDHLGINKSCLAVMKMCTFENTCSLGSACTLVIKLAGFG